MAANPFPDASDGRLEGLQGTKGSTGSQRLTKPLIQLGFLDSRSLVTAFYTYPELTPAAQLATERTRPQAAGRMRSALAIAVRPRDGVVGATATFDGLHGQRHVDSDEIRLPTA